MKLSIFYAFVPLLLSPTAYGLSPGFSDQRPALTCEVLRNTVESYIIPVLSSTASWDYSGTLDLGVYHRHHYLANISLGGWTLTVLDEQNRALHTEISTGGRPFVDLIDSVNDVRFTCTGF